MTVAHVDLDMSIPRPVDEPREPLIKRRMRAVLGLGLAAAAVALAGDALGGGPTGVIEGTLAGAGKGPTVVYIEKIEGGPFAAPAPLPVLGQKHNTFVPHVLPVLKGSKVEMRSEDPELHNVYAWHQLLERVLFNIPVIPKAPPTTQIFAKEGVVKITCNIHKEMLAWVIVLQNPYFVTVERGGSAFKIAGVPPGKYQLRVWGEKLEAPALGKRVPVEVAASGTVKTDISL